VLFLSPDLCRYFLACAACCLPQKQNTGIAAACITAFISPEGSFSTAERRLGQGILLFRQPGKARYIQASDKSKTAP